MFSKTIAVALFAAVCLAFVAVGMSAARAEDPFMVYNGKDGVGQGKHIVFLSGDEEYRSEEALPMLAKILSQRHGFKCTVLFAVDPDGTINPNNAASLPGAEALDTADVIVTSLRFRKYPDEVMKHFATAYDRGAAFVGLRTSTHAFNGIPGADYKQFNNFGKRVYGEGWVNHWGAHKSQATKGIIEAAGKDDPLLRGVTDIFCTTDVYEAYPAADAKILVRGQVLKGMTPDSGPADYKKKRASDKQEQGINDPMMPIVWTRLWKNESGKANKIFCTTMGAATDLENESLRRLVCNAVFWGCGFEVPSGLGVDYIDEYKPTMYGFNGFRKGLKPSDHALGKVLPAGNADPKKDDKKTDAKKPDEKPLAGSEMLKVPARPTRPGLPPSSIPLAFIKNERIALVGGSLAERMNLFGYFETLLHSRFPQQELVVRNFARPADEVGIRQRSSDYNKLTDPIHAFGADTFLCFFGFNESFAGPDGVEKFKADYEKFLDEYAEKYPRDDTKTPPCFVLVSPIAFETTGDKFLPDGKKENANLKLYSAAAKQVADKRKLAFIDIYSPTEALFGQQSGLKFTINGAHLNEQGDKEIAEMLDRALFGNTSPAQVGTPKFEKLRAAINEKSWVHHQDYRMLNGWYVYGGRRTYDTETFPREYLKIRNMAAKRDTYVWGLAQDKDPGPNPDDSNTGELIVPPTRFGGGNKSEGPELKYLSPEEEIKAMSVPPGFEVQLVASEIDHPELAKPDQLAFDNKGRLWVSCMPTYPQWKPGDPKPKDRLLIFEDFDKNGKAGKMTVFYDQLVCPTGFEFWNGGVLVVDEPRILFLKDTKGTGKADLVVQFLDGWATDDTHHCVNAWEFSNGGLLHMMEGVAMSTTVETPWGPFRNAGSSGVYVLDPRSLKLRHFNTPGYGNPWCYVFNWWGQGICGDGTGAQQHWDSCLSGEQFPGRRGVNPVFNNEGMRPVVGSEFLYSRQFPDNVQGQFIYACVINMNGMPRFEIHDDGAGYAGSRLKKKGVDKNGAPADVPDDLLSSTNKHFRPVDPQIGPDGALYFGDWANALIGHMQYSQRDPNRDHAHGRLYRLVYKDKPLLTPVTQFGKSVPEILNQLKEYEPRTRYRARTELRDRPAAEVAAAIKTWAGSLDANDKEYEHHLCEALWVEQSHHAVDMDLLKKVLAAKQGEARAAAVHLLADEKDYIADAFALIKPMVSDAHPRVRLEALRALSFYPTPESAAAAMEALNQPTDYWLTSTFENTIGALRPIWASALKSGELAKTNPKAATMLKRYEKGAASGDVADKFVKTLLKADATPQDKNSAYSALDKLKGDKDEGYAVFKRSACIGCHKVKNEGIEYGPDLTLVGSKPEFVKNIGQYLIESVIDPSAKMDAKYVTTNVKTTDGQLYSGFIVADDAKSLTIKVAVNGGKEPPKDIVIPKTDIKDKKTTKVSSMPEGLAGTMSAGEFLDVIEFLKSLK